MLLSLSQKLKGLYYFPIDLFDRLKNRDSLLPPRSMMLVNSYNFEQVGQEFKNYFVELANLKADHKVLDIGCGAGRMAIPLTTYLSEDGEYWGFDIRRNAIEWCQSHISSKYRNFHFLHSDAYNRHSNPESKVQVRDFVFPFKDDFFDFVILISVFTHMLPSDMENYFREISRVLKKDGTCFITFFLVNHDEDKYVRLGRRNLKFRFKKQNYVTVNDNNPEIAVAYEEEFINNLYRLNGLGKMQIIRHGAWTKRQDFLGLQDIIISNRVK